MDWLQLILVYTIPTDLEAHYANQVSTKHLRGKSSYGLCYIPKSSVQQMDQGSEFGLMLIWNEVFTNYYWHILKIVCKAHSTLLKQPLWLVGEHLL